MNKLAFLKSKLKQLKTLEEYYRTLNDPKSSDLSNAISTIDEIGVLSKKIKKLEKGK